jgi:hypothetical protein
LNFIEKSTIKGVFFIKIMLFNRKNNTAINWFDEKGMITFKFLTIGKIFEIIDHTVFIVFSI